MKHGDAPASYVGLPEGNLVGGFNPFEKYARQNGFIFPKVRGENSQKYLSYHHLEIDGTGR